VWLADRTAWEQRYPDVAAELLGPTEGAAVLPLCVGDRVLGAVGLTFRTPREFDPGERVFLLGLAGQAAVAFERAALADTRQEIADTLQHSLLPRRIPELEGLTVTARYLPGQRGAQAGGDWYDVLPLADGGVALAVGDVVGNGAAAAAVMGQLRSALATLLLEGHPPSRALELLDRFAARVEGARVSTAACLLLDPVTGRLVYSRAGHPPPLVLGEGGARFLDDGLGPALDLALPGRRRDAETELSPGSTLLLYTDGLVERRGATLDVGLDRLATAAAELADADPPALVDALLDRLLDGGGPVDDIAVVAARLASARLALAVPPDRERLPQLRREVQRWAVAAGLSAPVVDDLLLAVGEAAANAVEHAFPDLPDVPDLPDGAAAAAGHSPGRTPRVEVILERAGDTVTATVRDSGVWRPPPADRGFRGRGLQIIRKLSADLDVRAGAEGTAVLFRLRIPRAVPPPGRPEARLVEPRPARVEVSESAGVRCVRLTGDVDLAGVAAVRRDLLEALLPGPVVLDFTEVDSLSSAGMGLLLEAVDAAGGPDSVDVVLPTGRAARRALELTGLVPVLRPGR
jgi:anti-anti-sigma factor